VNKTTHQDSIKQNLARGASCLVWKVLPAVYAAHTRALMFWKNMRTFWISTETDQPSPPLIMKFSSKFFRNHSFFWLKQQSSDNMKTFKEIERNCLQKTKPSSQKKLKLFSSEWCYRRHPWVISDGFDSFFPGSACLFEIGPPSFFAYLSKILVM